jgi:hypothetical protein
MKKIVYDSTIASSIASAAVQKLLMPDADCVDIYSDGQVDPNQDEIYLMVDGTSFNSKKKNVHYIGQQSKSQMKRLLMVWERCFPGKPRPMVVHLLSRYQVSEEQSKNVEPLKKAIVGSLGDLSNTAFASGWRELLNNNIKLLNEVIAKGQSMVDYIDSSKAEQGVISHKEADKLIKENEALKDRIQELELQLKQATATKTAKAKKPVITKTPTPAPKQPKMSKIRASMKGMTAKQIKESFTVKEMRAVCKEVGIKGYYKMKEAEIAKELKKKV